MKLRFPISFLAKSESVLFIALAGIFLSFIPVLSRQKLHLENDALFHAIASGDFRVCAVAMTFACIPTIIDALLDLLHLIKGVSIYSSSKYRQYWWGRIIIVLAFMAPSVYWAYFAIPSAFHDPGLLKSQVVKHFLSFYASSKIVIFGVVLYILCIADGVLVWTTPRAVVLESLFVVQSILDICLAYRSSSTIHMALHVVTVLSYLGTAILMILWVLNKTLPERYGYLIAALSGKMASSSYSRSNSRSSSRHRSRNGRNRSNSRNHYVAEGDFKVKRPLFPSRVSSCNEDAMINKETSKGDDARSDDASIGSSTTGRRSHGAHSDHSQPGAPRSNMMQQSGSSRSNFAEETFRPKWTVDDYCCAIYISGFLFAVIGGWISWISFGISDGSWANPHIRDHLLVSVYYIYLSVILFMTILPTRMARAELMEAKDLLMGSMQTYVRYLSHELRTPLNTAFLGLNLAMTSLRASAAAPVEDRAAAADDQMELLTDISSSCGTALKILNDSLTYDKLESGMLSASLQETKAATFIAEAVKPFAVDAKERGVELVLNCGSHGIVRMAHQFRKTDSWIDPNSRSIPAIAGGSDGRNPLRIVTSADLQQQEDVMFIDKGKMNQVICNLVSNALKFSNPGATVTITAKADFGHNEESMEIEEALKSSEIRIFTREEALAFVKAMVPKASGNISMLGAEDTSDRRRGRGEKRGDDDKSNSRRNPRTRGKSATNGRIVGGATTAANTPAGSGGNYKGAEETNKNNNHIAASKPPSKDDLREYENEHFLLGVITISVTDRGIGIASDKLKSIFRQFSPSELQTGGSSGLGLWISKGIMDLHGGKLRVKSQGLGRGSTFTVILPVFRRIPFDVRQFRVRRNSFEMISMRSQWNSVWGGGRSIVNSIATTAIMQPPPPTKQQRGAAGGHRVAVTATPIEEGNPNNEKMVRDDDDVVMIGDDGGRIAHILEQQGSHENSFRRHSDSNQTRDAGEGFTTITTPVGETSTMTDTDRSKKRGTLSVENGDDDRKEVKCAWRHAHTSGGSRLQLGGYEDPQQDLHDIQPCDRTPLSVYEAPALFPSILSVGDDTTVSPRATATATTNLGTIDHRPYPTTTTTTTMTVPDRLVIRHRQLDVVLAASGGGYSSSGSESDTQGTDRSTAACTVKSRRSFTSGGVGSQQVDSTRSTEPLLTASTREKVETGDCTPLLPICAIPRVLVVDDSLLTRKMMCKTLRIAHCECDEAVDGVDAIKKGSRRQQQQPLVPGNPLCTDAASGSSACQEDKSAVQEDGNNNGSKSFYDFILMDFMMPNMDGPTATRELRALGYEGAIIGVTGNVLPADVEYFRECGADAVLAKPLSMDTLRKVLAESSSSACGGMEVVDGYL